MASAEAQETFECTPEQLYKIVSDYENYPKFLNEVKSCKVLKTDGTRKLVEFQVSLIKSFTYRLWMQEEPAKKVSWSLESGDFFKASNGFWELKASGEKTIARYWVEASFNIFVPGPIAKALVNVNLPMMMTAYKKRVKELYGG